MIKNDEHHVKSEYRKTRILGVSFVLSLLTACHTTDLGKSVGWPTPPSRSVN